MNNFEDRARSAGLRVQTGEDDAEAAAYRGRPSQAEVRHRLFISPTLTPF